VRTERPEALSLFRRWLEESSLLYCELTFRAAAVAFEGKITSLSDELVTLRSDDGRSKIRVALDLAVAFGFEDTRHTPKEAEEFDLGLMVFFEEPLTVEYPESVAFLEKRWPA